MSQVLNFKFNKVKGSDVGLLGSLADLEFFEVVAFKRTLYFSRAKLLKYLKERGVDEKDYPKCLS